jgi:hypothetical protein
MGYWIQNSRGKLEMISAGEIRQRIVAGSLPADTPCTKLTFTQELNPFWKKPFQPLQSFAEFAPLFQRPSTPHARHSGVVETFGWILLGVGLLCTAYFSFFYNTSVESGVGAVNNLGLMQNRTLGCIVGVGLAVVGTLMALLGRKRV